MAAVHEGICQRALELYELRGRVDGHALDDWLQAEEEVAKDSPKAAGASL
jgi:hypothetical protein